MTWNQRLKAALDKKGWTDVKLSELSGVTYGSLVKYLNGTTHQPRGNPYKALADALDIDEVYLRTGVTPQVLIKTIAKSTNPEHTAEAVGRRLQQFRETRSDGATPESFAEKHGFDSDEYASWERGDAIVPADVVLYLHENLEMSVNFIYTGKQ